MATFKPVVFRGTNHLKADGTTNVKIRIYHNGISQYLKTPYYIKKEYMSSSGDILPVYTDADVLNFELGIIVQKCRGICIKLGQQRCNLMNCTELKEYIEASLAPESEFIDFVKFAKQVISETEKQKTAEWYSVGISVLCWFYGRQTIDARDITAHRMNELAEALRRKGMSGKPLEAGAISNYLRAIRALYGKIKLKYNNPDYDIIKIPNEPFNRVKIPKYRRKKKNIQIDGIRLLRDFTSAVRCEEFARDVFMMQFYLMGINMKDLYELKKQSFGRVEYERSKTSTEENTEAFPLSIRIEPSLQTLFDKYSTNGFLSEIKKYSTHQNLTKSVNKGLASICSKTGMKKVTSGWARHSWASIARNNAGISKSDIDFCLGHVNNENKMADIYIDIDYSICDRCNKAVLDLM